MSSRLLKVLAGSGSKDAYEIDQSISIVKSDAPFMYRTPSSAGNRKTWTYSCWFKRHTVGITSGATSYFYLFACSIYGGNETSIRLQADSLQVWGYEGGSTEFNYYSNGKFRDVSAWYHIVVACDTTQGTAADRVKIYINGERVTDWSSGGNHPSQNFDTMINNTNWHSVGAYKGYAGNDGIYGWDGYVSEAYLIDGTALPVSSFGQTDPATGQWIPKEYTGGSYGTNGFYLKFASGAIGTDSSGNSNNYTTTNLANSDVMLDTPTNNYCTLNSTASGGSIFSQGNLKAITGSNTNRIAVGTMSTPSSGKWYWECKPTDLTGGCGIGVGNLGSYQTSVNSYIGNYAGTYLWYSYSGNGYKDVNGSNSSVAQSFAANDVVGVALDLDAGTLTMYKNGSSQLQVASGLSGQFEPVFGDGSGTNSATFEVNFGQKDFAHTPPSNHLALSTSNFPTPTIKKPSDHFNTILWTGDGTDDRSITGVGFQPDITWIKGRNQAEWHQMYDAVRGANKVVYPNDPWYEQTISDTFESFDSDGFTVGYNSAYTSVFSNKNNTTYAAWNWKANGTGGANTDGSINSTVSANTTAGFSIVTWTGNGNVVTVGHGLGAVPQVYIMKRRDSSNYWWVGNREIDGSHDYGVLDTTASISNSGLTVPTSSVFYTDGSQNTNNATYVAYVFAEVEDFSKIASYKGNGSTDGPFINTGFRPAYVLIKNALSGKGWTIFDTTRDINNPTETEIYAHVPDAEASGSNLDILSNGFKIRATNTWVNGSGNSIFYMAFAESPFKYANAR